MRLGGVNLFGLSIKIIWMILAIAFAIGEAATLALTMVWFSIGAMCALAVSYFTDSIIIQLLVFIIVSSSSLFVATRKLISMDRSKNKNALSSIDTNVMALVGKQGIVLNKISLHKPGLVKVKGEDWTAISKVGSEIDSGAEIEVVGIEGVKLVVVEKK